MRKTVIGLIGAVAIGIIACATIVIPNNSNEKSTTQSVTKWKKQAPQLFDNTGYSKLIESDVVNKNVVNESQIYIGKVTNPFGIRDDVLDFIINYFPNNESATYAAIRMEQTQVRIYYAKTDKEAVQISNNGEIAIWCLANNVGFSKAEEYINNKDKTSLDTVEGKNIDTEIRRKLGWKILGNHLSKVQMDAICEKGGY